MGYEKGGRKNVPKKYLYTERKYKQKIGKRKVDKTCLDFLNLLICLQLFFF